MADHFTVTWQPLALPSRPAVAGPVLDCSYRHPVACTVMLPSAPGVGGFMVRCRVCQRSGGEVAL